MRRSRSVPASAYAVFWTPLLDANINQESRGRYENAAKAFMAFVCEHGDRVEDAADLAKSVAETQEAGRAGVLLLVESDGRERFIQIGFAKE